MAALFVSVFATAPPAEEPTRQNLEVQYRAVMKAWDYDGDRRLSLAELDRMIEAGLHSPRPLDDTRLAQFKNTMHYFYVSQDKNLDGFVDIDELLSGALATFDCMDADKNGRASEQEIFTGMERCPSLKVP